MDDDQGQAEPLSVLTLGQTPGESISCGRGSRALARAPYLRLSTAIRTARPARTVPISQRWISAHDGFAFRNAAIEPAIMAIAALTVTLMTICVDPSASDCKSTLPALRSMNCGSNDKYSIAIFGLRRLVRRPIANNRLGLSTGRAFTSNGDRPPGRNAAQESHGRSARR